MNFFLQRQTLVGRHARTAAMRTRKASRNVGFATRVGVFSIGEIKSVNGLQARRELARLLRVAVDSQVSEIGGDDVSVGHKIRGSRFVKRRGCSNAIALIFPFSGQFVYRSDCRWRLGLSLILLHTRCSGKRTTLKLAADSPGGKRARKISGDVSRLIEAKAVGRRGRRPLEPSVSRSDEGHSSKTYPHL